MHLGTATKRALNIAKKKFHRPLEIDVPYLREFHSESVERLVGHICT
jgi:hypothetical protein